MGGPSMASPMPGMACMLSRAATASTGASCLFLPVAASPAEAHAYVITWNKHQLIHAIFALVSAELLLLAMLDKTLLPQAVLLLQHAPYAH